MSDLDTQTTGGQELTASGYEIYTNPSGVVIDWSLYENPAEAYIELKEDFEPEFLWNDYALNLIVNGKVLDVAKHLFHEDSTLFAEIPHNLKEVLLMRDIMGLFILNVGFGIIALGQQDISLNIGFSFMVIGLALTTSESIQNIGRTIDTYISGNSIEDEQEVEQGNKIIDDNTLSIAKLRIKREPDMLEDSRRLNESEFLKKYEIDIHTVYALAAEGADEQ